ncbi:Flp pilus assembly protein CpaB [Chengkuizengella axinellae]|uniref:Flp pilus assembly protein CpaB n=1 Tax=Chengkuizengella axinellae TaxID=3064388 RepID=A0ABT9IYR1_9BACL|nr:Flp pilus assembly protein CpaB [Chengkuizengella sp. 2205SS18-9]MDP5274493.1 Flp pilus assembly protein CpaB [Chengkuizengella sp. 2205SS18-9]
MKSKVTLILAIVMGLVTTLLFYKYMDGMSTNTDVNVKLVDVVAVNKIIFENQVINKSSLKVIQVPEDGVHSKAIKDPEKVIGKIALADFAANEVILEHRIGSEADESLFVSRKVTEGFRAVSIGVNFVTSVSNLIEPEDIVDVIWTYEVKDTKEIMSELLLEEVRVLAVGRRMIESTTDTEYVEYKSSTLELSANDAVKLVKASNAGSIQLILHGRLDKEDVKNDEE